MRVASFFSGIGGIDLGLERAGMTVTFQCEINKFCQGLLHQHWPDVVLKGDIDGVGAKDIPRSELWCGGFPCQDLSLANQGKRKGFGGNRSSLFYKYAGLVYDTPQEKRPRWLFMENVPGLLNSRNGADFYNLLKTLDELGYGVSWRVLDAKYFGTPQRRRRVYIIASRGSIISSEVLFEQGSTGISSGAGLVQSEPCEEEFPEEDCGCKEEGKGTAENAEAVSNPDAKGSSGQNPEANIFSIQHAGIGRVPTAGPQGKGFRNDGETFTCDSRGSSDAICQTNAPFGIRAASRVPEGLDSNRWRALGNAVCVPVIEWIGRRIMQVDAKYYRGKS